MTEEEARIYLPIDEENDLEDLYEEKLFELKQFFLSRFPISKLIQGRLDKFDKVEEAFRVLGGMQDEVNISELGALPIFESIQESYHWYNQERNRLRLKLSAASSFSEIKAVLQSYLGITKHYARFWEVPINDKDAAIVMAKEPDPMAIQEALGELSATEKITSVYISTLPDENVLKSEAKRLSLWLKFETNE